MITRAEVAAEAKRWDQVPYAHQGRSRIAVDCGGFVGCVAHALGCVSADFWDREFVPHSGYARRPSRQQLETICDAFMERIPVDDAGVGDVLGFRFRKDTQHLGIIVPYVHGGLAIMHALSSVGRVSEHILDDRWRSYAVQAWRLDGLIP